MPNPPGMVVEVVGQATDILFLFWNYTDQEITVTLTTTPDGGLMPGQAHLPPNATPTTLTSVYGYTLGPLPGGVYNVYVQPINQPINYEVATGVPVFPGEISIVTGDGNESAGHHPVWRDTPAPQ